MSLMKYNLFNEVFEDFFKPLKWYDYSTNVPTYLPLMDVYREDKDLILEVDVPGYEKEQLDVKIDKGVVEISGKVEEDTESEHYRETRRGSFVRRYALPKGVKLESAPEASLKNGVLKVVLKDTYVKEVEEPIKVEIT